jgi:hypothetical protein
VAAVAAAEQALLSRKATLREALDVAATDQQLAERRVAIVVEQEKELLKADTHPLEDEVHYLEGVQQWSQQRAKQQTMVYARELRLARASLPLSLLRRFKGCAQERAVEMAATSLRRMLMQFLSRGMQQWKAFTMYVYFCSAHSSCYLQFHSRVACAMPPPALMIRFALFLFPMFSVEMNVKWLNAPLPFVCSVPIGRMLLT